MLWFAAQKDPASFAVHLAGFKAYRFRIGNFRILCDIEDNVIGVLLIGRRDDIYRDL